MWVESPWIPKLPPPHTHTHTQCWTPVSEQCGNYKTEGDCYNREHTWPKSAWNGSQIASYTDLMHLYPTDGYDNNIRSNYWLGNADKATAKYVTSNGSFLSKCLPPAAAANRSAPHLLFSVLVSM